MHRSLSFAIIGLLIPFVSHARAQETGDTPPSSPRVTLPTDVDELSRIEKLEAEIATLHSRSMPANASLLRPTLLSEFDYRMYASEVEGNTGFAISRLRPGLVFTPTPWLRAVTAFEFAGETPSILDAFAKIRPAKWAEISAGYAKPPMFASFTYESVQAMPFPDRAPVVTAFRVRRDLGVDLHLKPRSVPLEGWIRISNGTGSALGNDNALPAGYGALDLVLGRAWIGSTSFHRTYGLRLGGSTLIESPRDRNGITGQTPFGFVYFRPIVVSGLRIISEGHLVGYAGPLRLTIEGAVAREERSRDDDGNPSTPRLKLPTMRSYGITTEVTWVLLGDTSKATAQQDHGIFEVAARYDGMWLGENASDVNSGGSQGGALAVKWWPTHFLAVSIAGYLMHFDRPPLEEPKEFWSWNALSRFSFFWGQ